MLPEILQKRIGCTFHQAVMLADAWSIIEATPKMVDTLFLYPIRWREVRIGALLNALPQSPAAIPESR